MTLSDPEPQFQGHIYFKGEYLATDASDPLLTDTIRYIQKRILKRLYNTDDIGIDNIGIADRGVYSTEAWTKPESWQKWGVRKSCIFSWKWGGRLRGKERLSHLSTYLHYIVFLSLSQKFPLSGLVSEIFSSKVADRQNDRQRTQRREQEVPYLRYGYTMLLSVGLCQCQSMSIKRYLAWLK